jgi:hypothetical protein
MLLTYGLRDQDYSMDPAGNPVPGPQGLLNAAYVPWQYMATGRTRGISRTCLATRRRRSTSSRRWLAIRQEYLTEIQRKG